MSHINEQVSRAAELAAQPSIASAIRAVERLVELGEPVDVGVRDALIALGEGTSAILAPGWASCWRRTCS